MLEMYKEIFFLIPKKKKKEDSFVTSFLKIKTLTPCHVKSKKYVEKLTVYGIVSIYTRLRMPSISLRVLKRSV